MTISHLLVAAADLEQQVTSFGVRLVLICSAILTIATIVALLVRKRKKLARILKLPLFLAMAGSMIVGTVGLMGSTIYLNTRAESGGPVHWHADIEFWACGAELELRDPHGLLSNKIGTATYHEHNDKRIHLEGVVAKKSEDASLTKFMRVVGGYLTNTSIGIPLNDEQDDWFASAKHDKVDGDPQLPTFFSQVTPYVAQDEKGPVAELINGQTCNNLNAELQVFVYAYDKDAKTYTQRKLERPTDYIMRDEPIVPPGDCVIVEFDVPKTYTDKLCLQYGVRDASRCIEFGVKEYSDELCNIRQTVTTGGLN